MSGIRGLRDYTPDETEKFEFIRQSFTELARLYSFRLMEPSPMEALETLEAKSGPGIRNEIYFFTDKGGRELGLRFDLTVGITRYACEDRGAQLPIKLASFADVFRYDEPQKGRYRWFYQWDIETYGSAHLESDAEMIDFTGSLLSKVGIKDYIIKIGDRGVVEEYIVKRLGRRGEQAIELMRALDKVDKKTNRELMEEYTAKGFGEYEVRKVLELGRIEGRAEEVESMMKEEGVSTQRMMELADLLKGTGTNFDICLSVVRGIDYYTSVVFEAFDANEQGIGSLAGGGRYDSLPKLFGRDDLPATGVAGGVERLMLAIGDRKAPEKGQRIYVAYTGGKIKEAISISSLLRKMGKEVMVDLQRRSLSKQLEIASRSGYEKVVIVAPEEISRELVIIKNMKDKTESRVELKSLAKEIL
ncbi:MAG: histidine--tRNA ligase [Conexivisphaerales archaeon]